MCLWQNHQDENNAVVQQPSEEKHEKKTVGGKDWAVTTGCLEKEVKSVPRTQKTETMVNFMKRNKEQSRAELWSTSQYCKTFLNLKEKKIWMFWQEVREMLRQLLERKQWNVKAALESSQKITAGSYD